MGRPIFLTDKQIAMICEISTVTLSRILNGFYRNGVKGKQLNLANAEPEVVGHNRRWRVDKVAKALGLSEEQIIDRIS